MYAVFASKKKALCVSHENFFDSNAADWLLTFLNKTRSNERLFQYTKTTESNMEME